MLLLEADAGAVCVRLQFYRDRMIEVRRLILEEQKRTKDKSVPSAFVTFKCASLYLLHQCSRVLVLGSGVYSAVLRTRWFLRYSSAPELPSTWMLGTPPDSSWGNSSLLISNCTEDGALRETRLWAERRMCSVEMLACSD